MATLDKPSTSLAPALRLHRYLCDHHLKRGALVGPDPGIRFNYRIYRFIKSYLRAIPWQDNLYYLQAQGYWILGNARLFEQTQDARYREFMIACADSILDHQQDDGAWPYPNPEWRGRVATAEGVWASIGLIEAYRHTRMERYLDGTLKWYRFMMGAIGFQKMGAQLAVNYFASTRLECVPNNSAFVLRFLAELSDVLWDSSYLETAAGMLDFLFAVQKSSGEMPYAVEGPMGGKVMEHFQCYQYNAFQCLDLMRYYEITGDQRALPIINKVLGFLETGVAEDGHVAYECDHSTRTVTYHTAVVAAAFQTATRMEMGDYSELAQRCYRYILERQRPDGSFPHSHGDYHYLSDLRSYPRYLSMILFHLLHQEVPQPVLKEKE